MCHTDDGIISHIHYFFRKVLKTQRDRGRQRETERDTDRHRETERDTDRHRETEKDTDRQPGRWMCHTDGGLISHIHYFFRKVLKTQKDRGRHRETERDTDRHTERQKKTQTDNQGGGCVILTVASHLIYITSSGKC